MRDESTAWAPARVCVVSEINPLATRAGSTEYLDTIVTALGESGATLDLIILRALGRHQLRCPDPGIAQYATRYNAIRHYGAILWRGHLYTTNPVHLLFRTLRSLNGWFDWRSERFGWLPPAIAPSVAWAGRILRKKHPDMVLANYFNAAAVFPGAPTDSVKVILVHDVMALRRQSHNSAGVPFTMRDGVLAEETTAFRSADLCLAIKEEEAAYIRSVAPQTRVATIPFACTATAIDADVPRPPVALFVGSAAAPNVDGLGWLLSEVWPQVRAARPDARLRVVGKVADAWEGPWPEGAGKVGFVDDLAAEYAQASLALTPLRYGSGVKIKLIEGLAHGLPGVATPVGAEGVEKAPDAVLRIADSARNFAAAVVATLNDPEPAATRRAARAFAETHYSREAVRRALAVALASIRS